MTYNPDNTPKKNPLSLQIDVRKFEKASEEEKAQHETMRESTTFFRDGMRKLRKNPLAVMSIIVLLCLVLTCAAFAVFPDFFLRLSQSMRDAGRVIIIP